MAKPIHIIYVFVLGFREILRRSQPIHNISDLKF